MDYAEATKVAFQRIEKLDPENVAKVMGYILLQSIANGERDMIRLAFCSEPTLMVLIYKVKRKLGLYSQSTVPAKTSLPTKFTPFTPSSSPSRASWPSSLPLPANNGLCIPPPQQFAHNLQNFVSYFSSQAGPYGLLYQPPIFPPQDQMASFGLDGSSSFAIPDQMSPSSTDQSAPVFPAGLSRQVCQNFRKGYCKYGGKCKQLHIFQMTNGNFMVLNPPTMDDGPVPDNVSGGPLKKLEMELIELLECRRGIPVTISSLPILYFDKYEKPFEIEGYPLDKGKASYRTTQLVAQMTKCIRILDRPHGRPSIILAEDINAFMSFCEQGHESQVYMTFPPDSGFSQQDLHNYFHNFGPVLEVRMPIQAKRMFGFVTFEYPETAALVLTKSNPHFICGAQVLVKPYRMKPTLVERKLEENVQQPIEPYFPDSQSKLPSIPKLGENTEENEQSLELKSMQFSEKEATNQSFDSQKVDGFARPLNEIGNQSEFQVNYGEGAQSNYLTSEVEENQFETCNDTLEGCEEVDISFPESLFAYDAAGVEGF